MRCYKTKRGNWDRSIKSSSLEMQGVIARKLCHGTWLASIQAGAMSKEIESFLAFSKAAPSCISCGDAWITSCYFGGLADQVCQNRPIDSNPSRRIIDKQIITLSLLKFPTANDALIKQTARFPLLLFSLLRWSFLLLNDQRHWGFGGYTLGLSDNSVCSAGWCWSNPAPRVDRSFSVSRVAHCFQLSGSQPRLWLLIHLM